MPWFKVDDGLWGHPKWMAASAGARALWVTAGSWCADQLQDGRIPTHVLPSLRGRPRDADELVRLGLWLVVEGGWEFHGWETYQPSREQVEEQRLAARERQRRARERAKSRRDDGVTHAQPTPVVTVPPTRPDPTVVPTELPEGSASPSRRSPETSLPTDWQPSDTHRKYATDHGLDLAAETFKFRNHAVANDRRQRNWNAAFSTWLARAIEYAPQRSPRAGRLDLPEAWR